MKTIAKNTTLGLAIAGMVVLMIAGYFLHDYTAVQTGATVFFVAAATRLALAASD